MSSRNLTRRLAINVKDGNSRILSQASFNPIILQSHTRMLHTRNRIVSGHHRRYESPTKIEFPRLCRHGLSRSRPEAYQDAPAICTRPPITSTFRQHHSQARPPLPSSAPLSARLRCQLHFYPSSPIFSSLAAFSSFRHANASRSFTSSSSSQNLLAHMEVTANNNPTSASAQNAFYSALLRANMPKIVVERFQTGKFASNDSCELTFRKALEQIAKAEAGGIFASGSNGNLTAGSGTSSAFTDEQLRQIASSMATQSKGIKSGSARLGSGGTGEKASPLHVVVDESLGSYVFKWAKFILSFGLVAYVTLVLITVAVEMTGVLRKVSPTNITEAQSQNQTARFSDVHGCDEAKEELQELVEFLRNPEKFSSLGGKLPKGVLLVGPPGTGKTLLARAVAGEAGVPFFYMSGSEFDEIYVGVGAKRMRELFAAARAKAPAIIFIDELDAVGAKRNERDPTYVKQSLNQLLTELDGFSQESGVIILGATNFPKLLDKALTRPGRFDRNVNVGLPDVRGRMAILKHHMQKITTSVDVDPALIARGTPGFSGAELESLVNQAAVRASRNHESSVSMLDMEWSKDKIMMGAERRSAVITEKDRLATAYHEAGHALVALYTKHAMPLYKATIMPRGQALGITHFMPEMDKVSENRGEMRAAIDVSMGGKAAEEIIYGEDGTTSGCAADIQNATMKAYSMITRTGMSTALGNIDYAQDYRNVSPATRSQIETEVRQLIEDGHARARALLESKRDELDKLAKALVDYEILDLEEMRKVIRGESLKKMKALPAGEGRGIKLPTPLQILPSPSPGAIGSRVDDASRGGRGDVRK